MNKYYISPQEAFEDLYEKISNEGEEFGNTLALFNVGFSIINPSLNLIETPWRKWSKEYAEKEWKWYLSGNRSAVEIAKEASIWYNCMDDDGNVNSNYGWHWSIPKHGKTNQLEYVIGELRKNPQSRRACITILDCKSRDNFSNDTPCTYAINFYIKHNALYMNVMMRSNDLWYGFCNDQYCFSKLHCMVAYELGIDQGVYYHFANNIHLYNNKLNKNN